MMIKKKDRFKSKSGKVYEIAGRWGQDFILAPVDKTDDECLIYTSREMEDFLETGYFVEVRI
jgi:hypothetical protein